jgi:hypothetical protein
MGSRRTSFLGKSDYFPMWIARHFPAVPGRGAIPVTTGQSPVASTEQSPAMSGSHCSPSGRLYPQEKTKACERRSAFLAPPAPTTKPRPLLRSASFATSPTPSSTTPWPGDRPTEPSGRGLSLGEEHGFGVNRVAVKPSRRRIGADDRNAVTVIKKPAQPGDVAIPPTEWWIHEHQAGPRLSKTVIAVGEDPTGRHPVLWSR